MDSQNEGKARMSGKRRRSSHARELHSVISDDVKANAQAAPHTTSPDDLLSSKKETPDSEPLTKVARLPSCCVSSNCDEDDNELPLAPSIGEYIAPGGADKYRPRPEWYGPRIITESEGSRNANDDYDDNNEHHHQNNRTRPQDLQIAQFLDAPADGLLNEDHLAAFLGNVGTGDDSEHEEPEVLEDTNATEIRFHNPTVFGKDWDPALHMAIRANATDAALALLRLGAAVDSRNAKGATPIILASQKGLLPVVRELLSRGASPCCASFNGSSALLQAAHFGHADIVEELLKYGGRDLLEAANYNHTTPLMRSSQEGHANVVVILLEHGASVNRRNRVQMTALMLASQRGHAVVCKLLIDHGADVDATINQNSSALHLACKRGHVEVVRTLLAAGCELFRPDAHGRTVREVAQRRENKELLDLLDPSVQVSLMQTQARKERSFQFIKIWTLLQQERATVQVHDAEYAPIQSVEDLLRSARGPFFMLPASTQAMLRTLTLPAPLVESIALFLPLPQLWNRRMNLLTKRSVVNADAAVSCALDMIDEILEEGGFLEACEQAGVSPPTHHVSWLAWKQWARNHCIVSATTMPPQATDRTERRNVTMATIPPPRDSRAPSLIELRRHASYLQILAFRSPVLKSVLSQAPYNMPKSVVQQLMTSSDIASLARRVGPRDVHFEPPVAMDLIMLLSRLCSWYWQYRENPIQPSDNPYLSFNRTL